MSKALQNVVKLNQIVYVRDFGAVPGQPSADAIQAAINAVVAAGGGHVVIGDEYPIEKTIVIGPRPAGTNERRWIVIDGQGGRLYKHSTFTGQCLVRVAFTWYDEDYLSINNLFLDGVNKTVNGLDWFKESVPYNALRTQHFWVDSFYSKAVMLNDCSFERCYRGLRHSGNAARFFGCIFRDNICGEFRVAASNDVSFQGCSFRRNQFGSHLATNDPAFTSVGASYDGCIWESNFVTGIYIQGAGNQTFINPYFEGNAEDLSYNDYLDKPSAMNPGGVSTNFYQVGVAGFASFNNFFGGHAVGAGATTADLYAPFAVDLTVINFRGGLTTTGTLRGLVWQQPNTLLPLVIQNPIAGEDLYINGQKFIINNGKPKLIGEMETWNYKVYRGSKVATSFTGPVMEFSIPNAEVSYAFEITAFANRMDINPPFVTLVENSRFEKAWFFVNRATGLDVQINKASASFSHEGPHTTVGDPVNALALDVVRTGSEGSTSAQKIGLQATINAAGAFARCSFEFLFKVSF
jgi:hypothetical protein